VCDIKVANIRDRGSYADPVNYPCFERYLERVRLPFDAGSNNSINGLVGGWVEWAGLQGPAAGRDLQSRSELFDRGAVRRRGQGNVH
jgi:hypothetical protein